MALYIVTKSGTETSWHINNAKKPYEDDHLRISEEVAYIQADGDELDHIKYIFCSTPEFRNATSQYTIPMVSKRVVRWYGSIAHTILGNL